MDIRQNIAYKEQALANTALSSKDPAIVGSALRHIQMATQNGTIPAYVGIPLVGPLAQHFKQLQAAQAMPAPQMPGAAGPQPTIAEQAMAEAQGIEQAQSNLPPEGFADGGILNFQPQDQYDAEHEYAVGGMVAFAGGNLVDDDDTEDEDDYEDRVAAAKMADFENQAEGIMAADSYLNASRAAAPASGISAINLTPAAAKGFGLSAAAPSGTGLREEAKAPRGIEALEARVLRQESGGRRYDKEGNLLTSSKGAQGEMQVMPATQRDPGFGVKPAKDDSPEEKARVGRDYLRALYNRYGGDEQLTLMAYNWGPGNVDKYLKSGRDIAMVPAETRKYASLAKGGIAELPTKHYVLGDLVMGDFGEAISADPRVAAELDEFGRPVKDVLREKPLSKEGAQALEKLKSNAARQAAANAPKAAPKGLPSTPAERIAQGIKSLPRPSAAGVAVPALVGYGGYQASDYAANVLRDPNAQKALGANNPLQGALSGDTALAANIQAQADDKKPIAKWIPDWLLPADLKERRDVEMGVKKPEPAKPAAAAPAAAPEAELPPAAVQDPTNPLNYVETKDPFEGNPILKDAYEWYKNRKEGLASDKEQDKWMSILAAGLGMLGGSSPFAGANIGQGALQGIQAQLASNKMRAREESHLGDFASKLGLAHEAAQQHKEVREAGLGAKYQTELDRVKKDRLTLQEKYLKQPKFIPLMQLPQLAEKIAKGKASKEDQAKYNTLLTLESDLENKLKTELPDPDATLYGIKTAKATSKNKTTPYSQL